MSIESESTYGFFLSELACSTVKFSEAVRAEEKACLAMTRTVYTQVPENLNLNTRPQELQWLASSQSAMAMAIWQSYGHAASTLLQMLLCRCGRACQAGVSGEVNHVRSSETFPPGKVVVLFMSKSWTRLLMSHITNKLKGATHTGPDGNGTHSHARSRVQACPSACWSEVPDSKLPSLLHPLSQSKAQEA